MTQCSRHCAYCGKPINPTVGDVNRGKGRFCSRTCSNHSRARPIEARFMEGVGRKLPNGCIPWVRSTRNGWHGQIGKGGHGTGSILAHRVAYELFVGPIPPGLCVCHHCDNPVCVNPTHLFLGTQTDNLADMTAKGRRVCGERQGGSKLTTEAVREIRRRSEAGETHRSIARAFGISFASVTFVVQRKRWKHVA